MDGFFRQGFKASKCKTLLKLTIPRIKLLRNKREVQVKQMRRDIANLLQNGQEATARIRVEHIIREENMMAAQEILELFCELVTVRLPIIETQRECPLDLKEAISSICFAAPRCSDLPELQQVQMLFITKYGKEFVTAATELMPDCGVNRQIIELLSIRAPPVETKLKLLKEIAEEHEVDWDPAATETEFLKPHEDLLNSPNDIIGGSKLPLPKDKHEEQFTSIPTKDSPEQDNSDTDLDFSDLPEVPKTVPHQIAEAPSPPETAPKFPTFPDLQHVHETTNDTCANENVLHIIGSKPDMVTPDSSLTPPKQSETRPTFSQNQSETNIDLQDVLAAAHAAADSAERAAAAARSAANLAQARITEFVMKKNNNEKKCHVDVDDQPPEEEKAVFDQRQSFGESVPHHGSALDFNAPNTPDTQLRTLDSDEKTEFLPALPPSRSSSMENDPYSSYPNLFGRQESDLNSRASDISRGKDT
ncbi:hypothetical protein QJS04_geneDACA000698 [Acorus gramineus]|uniref:IST1 homolog n=1 Tax=Acorus gramineus TaxID=55184 RepID=A0AAV9ASZ2_ACOGR|nr:hypothetical protein QJS04_geneDACA000698 [Acorus gramineus]